MAKLYNINNEAQNIVRIISSIIRSEVVLFDDSYKIIAGTGKYSNIIDKEYKYKNILKKVMYNQKPLTIKNPGSHKYCDSCDKYNDCNELIAVFFPICLENKLLGIIKLEAHEEKNREYLLKYQSEVIEFLDKISELLKNKLIDQMINEKSKNSFDQLQALINSLETGIIATDAQGVITNFNKSAELLLDIKKSEVIGKHVNEFFPGSTLVEVLDSGIKLKNKEVSFQYNKVSKKIIINANPIKNNLEILGIVASLKGIQDLHKLLSDFNLDDYNPNFKKIVGQSQALKRAKKKVLKVAKSSSSVLIRGESGTGKELFAEAIHEESLRNEENFISINCAAIPGELLESELFGYEAGAFTGAKAEGKPGKLELANKGTVFLDEIGDMPLSLQAKILKVIQEKSFFRIGGVREINIDIRIISATNKDLENLIKKGEFREDLYYRLNVIPLNLPPLRERINDISPLVKHFIDKYNLELNKDIKGITQGALKILYEYNWPGNIRELENVIEYAVNMENDFYIKSKTLPPYIVKEKDKEELNANNKIDDLETAVSKTEKKLITKALDKYGRSTAGKYRAAQELGIGKTTLYNKINKYAIE